MVDIYIHSSLTRFTDNNPVVQLPVDTMDEIIPALCQKYPLLSSNIISESGELTPYVHCYVNGEQLSTYEPKLKLVSGTKIELITALVGG